MSKKKPNPPDAPERLEIPKVGMWSFHSVEVARKFDAHVREQLPWYDHLLDCISLIGAHYIPENGQVYDIGASTGNVGLALRKHVVTRNAKLVSIEKSLEMSRNHKGLPGEWVTEDALKYDFARFDFAVLNLVLMFLPVGERVEFVRKLRGLLKPGGAMVIVDKVLAPPGYLGTVLRRMAISWKLAAGASPEDVVAKELSLGGVQRPISPAIIPAGAFEFFRFGEFAGWVVERPEDAPDSLYAK